MRRITHYCKRLSSERLTVATGTHHPFLPSTAFSSFAAEDEQIHPVTRDFLQSSLASATALLGVISQVLEFSKLSAVDGSAPDGAAAGGGAGQAELVLAPMSLTQVVNELVDLTGLQAAAKGVELVTFVSAPLFGATLEGDALRVRQCLYNLVDNSLKARLLRSEETHDSLAGSHSSLNRIPSRQTAFS